MGPQNGIIGDAVGIDLPQGGLPEDSLKNERAMAAFSKTKEFQRLKETIEERIKFYESWLPGGEKPEVTGLSVTELGHRWLVANEIIGELRGIILAYEMAKEVTSANQSV